MKRHIFTVSILLVAAQLFGQESRFWVGGEGSFTDESHWATVSGGEPGATVPESGTNVVFDENSFSSVRSVVLVDEAVSVGNLIATNANFAFSGNGNLNVGGSVNVDGNADFGKLRGALVFSASGSNTINLQSAVVGDVVIDGGNWTLTSDFETEGNITLKSGSLNTNGHNVTCAVFSATENANALNIANSTIVCDRFLTNSAENLTVKADGSEIVLNGSIFTDYLIAKGQRYNIVRTKSAAKFAYDIDVDLKSTSCPTNAIENTYVHDGEAKITVAGSGVNLIILKLGVQQNTIVKRADGVSTETFKGLAAGDYSMGYFIGSLDNEESVVTIPKTIEAPTSFSGDFAVATEATCFGDDIELMANINGGTAPYSYKWSKSGGESYTTETIMASSGARYYLTATDSKGCKFSLSPYTYIAGNTHSDYTTGPDKIEATITTEETCEGEYSGIMHIAPTGGSGIYTKFDLTGAESRTSTLTDITGLHGGDYEVVVTDNKGCTNLTNLPANVINTTIGEIPAPTADAGADVYVCYSEGTYKVTDAAFTHNETISWTVQSGTAATITSGETTVSPILTFSGTGDVTLLVTVTNGTCTPVTDTKIIHIIETPNPTITSVDADICGLNATITATSSSMYGEMEAELVSGAGIATISGLNVSVDKAGAYTFRVKEVEQSAAKCEGYSSNTITLTFFNSPAVSLTSTSGSTCGTDAVSLSGEATDCTTTTWTKSANASGSFSSTTTPNTVYTPSAADAGKTLTLTLTGSNGGVCPDAVQTYTLVVNEVPTPTNNTVAGEKCGLSTPISATLSHGGTATWKAVESGVTFANPNAVSTTMTVTTAGTYHIYIEEDNGCIGTSAQVEVIFRDEPTLTITNGASGTICGNETIDLTATTNCTPANVVWTSTGAGSFSSTSGLNTTYTPAAGDYGNTITITATVPSDYAVCATPATATFSLSVSDVPNPTITSIDGNTSDNVVDVCGTSGISATATAALGGTLTWASAGTNLQITPSTGATVTLAGDNGVSYGIIVTETTSAGCSAESPVRFVTFHTAPVVTVPSATDICETDEVNVTATATNATSLNWTTSGAGTLTQVGSASSMAATYTPAAADIDTDVTLTATASNGGICANDVKTYTFHVYANPNPSMASTFSICGTTDQLTATVSAGNTITWSAPTSVTLTNASVAGTTATVTATLNDGADYGDYVVTMKEKNAAGCEVEISTTVTFVPKPVLELDAYEATICAGESYTVNAVTHDNFTNYQWIASDGGTLALGANSATYNSVASTTWKQVTITVTPKYGCDESGGKTMTLTVNPMPVPNIDDETVCGLEYTLPATTQSVSGITSDFAWSTASPGASISATQFKANAEGTYTLRLTEMVGSCQAYDEAQITFVAKPEANAGNDDVVCADELTYDLSAATADHYSAIAWSTSGDGSFSDAAILNPTYTFTDAERAAGSVTLTLTITPNAPCVDPLTSSLTITINPLPVPTISGDATICQNETGTYTTESGMTNYQWYVDGALQAGATSSSFDYTWATDGAYTVSVSYTDANGCSAATATDFAVTVYDLPVSALPTTENSCTNGNVIINAAATGGSGNFSYAWSGNGVNYLDDASSATPIFACDVAGTYNLTCTITDNTYGCSTDAKIEITNIQGPSVNAGSPATVCYLSSHYLADATYSDAYGVTWSTAGDGTFDDADILNATYTPGAADWANGTVTLTLTAYSSTCGSVTSDVTLTLLPELNVGIGGIIPFKISASTRIDVQIEGDYTGGGPDGLGFYLVAPDGTEVKLYNNQDYGMPMVDWILDPSDFNIKFTTSSSSDFNLDKFGSFESITGDYTITGDWSTIYGKNPAEGGWAVKLGGNFTEGGVLRHANISFTDINYEGNLQTITFDSKVLSPAVSIPKDMYLSYISPIGLRVSCYGACDARAVAKAIGGSGTYELYEWSKDNTFTDIISTNDTTDLCAGTYYVRVTDNNGCSAIGSIEIGTPEKIQISKLSQTNVTCNGGDNASIEVTSTNGIGTVSYQWLDSLTNNVVATTALADNLYAGKFTVVATDENQCVVDSTFEITEPTKIEITSINVTPTSCTTTDGVVVFTVSGGTPGLSPEYTITCTDAGATIDNTTLTVSNLSGGNITFTITDFVGCSIDTTISTTPDPILLSLNSGAIECHGGTTSVATVISGGAEPYTYLWSNGQTGAIAVGLVAGTYYVDVTDNLGCTASDTIVLAEPAEITPDVVFTQPIRCYGDTEASFYATAVGGTTNGGYTYNWFDVNTNTLISTDSIVSNVGEGIYAVEVADLNGCVAYDTTTIVYPKLLYITGVDTTKSECAVPTGTATVNVAGGLAPYSYNWHSVFDNTTIATTETATALGADLYFVEVTDALGCTIISDTIEILDKGNIKFEGLSKTDVACIQHCTGEASISTVYAEDEQGNLLDIFQNSIVIWNGKDTVAQGETAKTLCYGSNRVMVIAENGCRSVGNVEIGNSRALRVTNVENYPDLTGAPYCDGSLTATIGGGIGNYTYVWTNEAGDTIQSVDTDTKTSIYSLCEGYYTLHVEDENPLGCSINETILIEHRPLTCSVLQVSPTTCFGGSDGALEVVGVGGYYEGYNYKWRSPMWPADSVATTAFIDGLAAGKYIFTISQSNGRVSSYTDSLTVTQPTTRLHIPNGNFVNKGSYCYNEIGEIKIFEPTNLAEQFGGNTPFNYYFTNSEGVSYPVLQSGNNPKLENLASGDYNLHVVDNLGCVFDTIVNVKDLSEFKIEVINNQKARCYDYSDGKLEIEATIKDGHGFTYQWQEVGSTEVLGTEPSLTGLSAGYYQITVTDSTCVKDTIIELIQPEKVTFSVSSTVNSCYNLTDGEVMINDIQGGESIYNRFEFFGADGFYYEDNTTQVDTSNAKVLISSVLPTGDYKVRVSDVKSCVSDSIALTIYSARPEIAVMPVIPTLPTCQAFTADGKISNDGAISVTALTMMSNLYVQQVSSTTNDELYYSIDGGAPQTSGIFNNLASGTHYITIGISDELECPVEISTTLGSKNGFYIDSVAFTKTGTTDIYTCPDNDLNVYAHTTSAYNSMTWFTPAVEGAASAADEIVITSSIKIDSVLNSTDSVMVYDTITIYDTTYVSHYSTDEKGNIVLGTDATSKEPNEILPFSFMPYGSDTYYYVKAENGVCMDIDSTLRAVALYPSNSLDAHIVMDNFDSEELKRNGVYELSEGAEVRLVVSELDFDDFFSTEYNNNFRWAASSADVQWLSSPDTMPAIVRPFAEALIFRVEDSVQFTIAEVDTFVCRYTDSIKVTTINGITPWDVFTPNADGQHDTWKIEGLSSYEHVNIYVFNRWGGRVWQYSGSGIDYDANQWDGKNAKNKPLPSGTYYYVIQCSSDKLGGKKKTGPVTIIR